MADVFISYKKEDRDRAEGVVAALRADGFSVFWDEGLTPKEAWDAMLEQEIGIAGSVVVLWSPRAINSEWVRTEAHYGQDRGKLVPVMIESCTLPLAFMLKQTVDLSRWNGDRGDRQWRKLQSWVADLISTKPGAANIPQALGAAQPNRFREAVGYLPSGEAIVDGALVNHSTPAGTLFRDGENLPVMRILAKGSFLLGSVPHDPDRTAVEGPQKRIEIPSPFALGVFPVLVREYQAMMGTLPALPAAAQAPQGWLARLRQGPAAPVETAPPDPALPVVGASFDEATGFIDKLSTATGAAYRIPSETEWEYACRAGSPSRYSCGDTIGASQAAYASGNAGGRVAPTGPVAPGSFSPNAFGLYDMHGNVREWCADLWHESYDTTPHDGEPALDGQSSMRVVRGGAWSDPPALLRSSARMRATQSGHVAAIGFRVARSLV